MTVNYEPTRKEVFVEIFGNIGGDYFTKDNIRNLRKGFTDASKIFFASTATLVSAPYVVPSFSRLIKEVGDEDVQLKVLERIGLHSGFFTGLVADIGQLFGYFYLAVDDHPEALLIPLATNVVSGLYEIGRHKYRSVRNRLVEKHRRESLESVVSAPQE